MNLSEERKQFLAQIILRASSGLYYIEDELRYRSGGTDGAYSRSRYILISYCVDLILNALLLLSIDDNCEDTWKELKAIGRNHNFETMFSKVSHSVAEYAGVAAIKKSTKRIGSNDFIEYLIDTVDGEQVKVNDFIEVRYDFTKKHGVGEGRLINADEVADMKKQIATLRKIISALKKLL